MKYGSVEYREKRNREERGWIDERIQIIEQIPDNAFQSICYFSVLERFAQEYSNYPKHDATKAFCEFIMAFQENYDFLGEYDPVTLYYDFENELENNYNLSFLDYGVNYNPDHAVQYGKANEMIEHLNNLGVKRQDILRHRYVRLLYSLRSSLSHECSCHNAMMSTNLHLLNEYPYYVHCFRSCISTDSVYRDQVWHLVIPVGFIRKLTLECIDNYLKHSLVNKDDPFENDSFFRKSHIAWFDSKTTK